MAKRKKHWSAMVEAHGVSVRVYERAGTDVLWASVVTNGKKQRTSLKTDDRKVAENRAKAMAKELAEIRLTGRSTDTLTLSELVRLYLHHRRELLSADRLRFLRTTFGMLRLHLGDNFSVADFGKHHVETYVAARQSGKVQPNDRRAADVPEVGTIRNELAALSSACNWAAGFRQDGRALLSRNPLREKGMMPSYSPRDRKRPRADEARYKKLAKVAGDVEPRGQFGLALDLAWGTGRRIDAILHLTVSDLLFTVDSMRAALAEAGMDEDNADQWPAAIRWRAEHDKTDRLTITPVPAGVVEAVKGYLRTLAAVGDAWLFPAATKPGKPTPMGTADSWLRRAEKLAKLPHLTRGGWHAFRRGWATRRKDLPAQDVAFVGGWADTKTLADVYTGTDPISIRKVLDA